MAGVCTAANGRADEHEAHSSGSMYVTLEFYQHADGIILHWIWQPVLLPCAIIGACSPLRQVRDIQAYDPHKTSKCPDGLHQPTCPLTSHPTRQVLRQDCPSSSRLSMLSKPSDIALRTSCLLAPRVSPFSVTSSSCRRHPGKSLRSGGTNMESRLIAAPASFGS